MTVGDSRGPVDDFVKRFDQNKKASDPTQKEKAYLTRTSSGPFRVTEPVSKGKEKNLALKTLKEMNDYMAKTHDRVSEDALRDILRAAKRIHTEYNQKYDRSPGAKFIDGVKIMFGGKSKRDAVNAEFQTLKKDIQERIKEKRSRTPFPQQTAHEMRKDEVMEIATDLKLMPRIGDREFLDGERMISEDTLVKLMTTDPQSATEHLDRIFDEPLKKQEPNKAAEYLSIREKEAIVKDLKNQRKEVISLRANYSIVKEKFDKAIEKKSRVRDALDSMSGGRAKDKIEASYKAFENTADKLQAQLAEEINKLEQNINEQDTSEWIGD